MPLGGIQRVKVATETKQITGSTTTRPADTLVYAAGDLIANSTTAASVTAGTFSNAVRVAGGSGVITGMRLKKSDDDVSAAKFRLHLFLSDPTATNPTNGDNGVIQLTAAIADHIGSWDFNMTVSPDVHTDGNWAEGVPVTGQFPKSFKLASGTTVYYLLEARDAYVPASAETLIPYMEVIQD